MAFLLQYRVEKKRVLEKVDCNNRQGRKGGRFVKRADRSGMQIKCVHVIFVGISQMIVYYL